jgi:hypothetical protein
MIGSLAGPHPAAKKRAALRERLTRPISWAPVILEKAFLHAPVERNRRIIGRGVLDRLTR